MFACSKKLLAVNISCICLLLLLISSSVRQFLLANISRRKILLRSAREELNVQPHLQSSRNTFFILLLNREFHAMNRTNYLSAFPIAQNFNGSNLDRFQ